MKSSELLTLLDLNDEEWNAVITLIRKIKRDRKTVEINSKPVETTARNPQPEKR